MITSKAFHTLFFVSDSPIGRGLPEKLSRNGEQIIGPWRDTRKTDTGAETSDRPITLEMIAQHLSGSLLDKGFRAMLMPYTVDSQGMAVATVIDLDVVGEGHADLPQHFETVVDAANASSALYTAAAVLGLRAWIETTRSGGKRLWIFHHPLPAADAKDLGRLLLKRADLHPRIEVFPKQTIASADGTGNGVFLPYWGRAAPGRQVITDPLTGEEVTADAFAEAALASRSTPEFVAAILQAARESGKITATRSPAPRQERTGEALGERGDVSITMWPVQTARCAYLHGLVEQAESGQQIGYDAWLRLAGHLRIFGAAGRKEFHRLSEFDDRYDAVETDHKFDSLTGGSPRCDTASCGKDPYVDCGLPKDKVSSAHWAYKGMALTMASSKQSKSAEIVNEASTNPNMIATVLDVPPPAGRTDKGSVEYFPYQVAQILGLDTQAPDTDAALAYRAKRIFKNDLRYCKGLGWLHWQDGQWITDDRNGSRTASLFVTLSRTIREEVAHLFRLVSEMVQQSRTEDADALGRAARAHLRHIKMVESEPFAQRAMVLARPLLTVDAKDFQPRPWLLGFKNGVWDKGEWREHRREDYLLNLCPIHIGDPRNEVLPPGNGEWGNLLNRITGGDSDYARTLQEVAGYALSGASHLRLLPWAYGGKGTGKSTLAELLTVVLGDGAASVDTKLLGSDAPRERLGASLWGKRLVVCAEAGHQRIDAELLKTLSGGDSYPVRFHYQEAFTARPTHVLLMTANDPPSMNAYDDALRDRVLALPCQNRLEGNDPERPDRLTFSDGARIEDVRRNPDSTLVREFAAWALSGMKRVFVTQSIYRSARVRLATAQFWRDTDPLTSFWETMDESQLKAGIARQELRRLYDNWCLSEGIRKPMGPQLWTRACVAAGLHETRIKDCRGWKLVGDWQFTYTSYTLSPILGESHMKENELHEGLLENSPGSVRSVRSSDFSTALDEWEDA